MTLPQALAVVASSFLLATLTLTAIDRGTAPVAASGAPAPSPPIEDRRDPVAIWLDNEWFACLDRGGRLTYPFGCTR